MSLLEIKADSRDAIITLQILALRGLARWLSIDRPDDQTISKTGLMDTAALLSQPNDLTEKKSAAVRRFSNSFAVTDPPVWTSAQKRWLGKSFRPALVPAIWAFALGAARRMFGRVYVRSSAVAPLLATSISVDAWTNPGFRREVAKMLKQHLRLRVILHPDDGAPPVLSMPCLWIAATDGLNHGRLPGRSKMGLALKERMAARAAAAFEAHGWAGFWDGYVLMQAKEAGCAIFTTDMTLDPAAKAEIAPQFRESWRDSVPGYAAPLLAKTL